ncbi:hydrogenase maturation protease [Nonomuraea sp. NPDC046570]|uniref:hydrogenase maturation protease n=1 Tax=Nonomuraea sp. NPDC046570 TaxID=3155255 RepID=UPI00340391B6
MTPRMLVAGVGNVFLGDDGFGVEVVRHLSRGALPPEVKLGDFGIRGIHLAYELMNGYDTTILIDALPRGEAPGTVYVLDIRPEDVPSGTGIADAHDMAPEAVLALLGSLGGRTGRVLLVGCEPADISPGMELTRPVAAAVPRAAELVGELIRENLNEERQPC